LEVSTLSRKTKLAIKINTSVCWFVVFGRDFIDLELRRLIALYLC
jgi:hypothetical protein